MYYLGDQIKDGGIGVACVARMAEMTNAYKIFAGKPEGGRPFGQSRHRCKDN
jgi:hypothetical protein